MKGGTTLLSDPDEPNEEARKFAYDHSYWSHDGCKEEANGYWSADSKHANGAKFADQKRVFDDLGVGVYNNAWEGFNTTLFAYGQTGSGKSWSVVGYGVNKGIVPLFCEKVFQGIDEKKASGEKAEYEVMFSMLEIYMEETRDLLNPKKGKGGLRIREHKKKGFYAEGLTVAPVSSYAGIEKKMEEGTTNRTVAATQMNATSSRAHTIVGLTLIQKFKNAAGEDTTKSAVVNLVDLAGSERAESTGATGDRLKEGAAINTSLSALGNCIAALADAASGKRIKVPFRDSVLTKLLKNALGGNSRTIMIAAISPADINYEETLGTLRYADRAKQIKCKAVVNEDPTEKLIRSLKEENERLKQMLAGGKPLTMDDGDDDDMEGLSDSEKAARRKEMDEDYLAAMEENEREMEEMKKAFEEKLKAYEQGGPAAVDDIAKRDERRKTEPHLYNVNFDSQLSGKIVHFIEGEKTIVGKGEGCNIKLIGPGILDQHAVFTVEGGKYYVEKLDASARVTVDGEPVTKKSEVDHNDRVMFGTTQMFGFSVPKQRDASKKDYPTLTFDMFQSEIASKSGFDMSADNKSRDDMLLQEDLMDMRPAVEQANSISEELDKKKQFEMILVSPEARGELKGRSKIFVRVIDLETNHEWMWTREKFLSRKFMMQEMFQKSEDGEKVDWPPERDPFAEDPDAEQHIGSVKVWLQSLAYNIEIDEQLEVTNFKGQEIGLLKLEVIPCDKKGKEYSEKDNKLVDEPAELVGKDVHYIIKIINARGLPNKYKDIYAKYIMYQDEDYASTKTISDTSNPDWNFKKQFDCNKASKEFVEYLTSGAIMVQIWGKLKPDKNRRSVDTKDARLKNMMAGGQKGGMTKKTVDASKVKFAMELCVAKKRAERSELKINQFKELVRLAEEHEKPRLSTKLIKDLLGAPTQDAADRCLKMVPKEPGAAAQNESTNDNEPPKTPPAEKPQEKPAEKPQKEKEKPKGGGGEKSSTCVLL